MVNFIVKSLVVLIAVPFALMFALPVGVLVLIQKCCALQGYEFDPVDHPEITGWVINGGYLLVSAGVISSFFLFA